MKKVITFLLLVAAISVNAQTKIKSAAVGDSIILQKGAVEIQPVIVTAVGDTARSMNWMANQMARDTTVGFVLNVSLFNKLGVPVAVIYLNVPPLTNTAAYLAGLDSFILNTYPRFRRP